jgi:hypothetical protein
MVPMGTPVVAYKQKRKSIIVIFLRELVPDMDPIFLVLLAVL